MKAYAIKDPIGNLILHTIEFNESECKISYQNDRRVAWDILDEQGYRCVPVEITEIKQEKKV